MASVPLTNNQESAARAGDDSISATLPQIEALLDESSARMFDGEYFEKMATELRRLHARVRVHHAANELNICDESEANTAPELLREQARLRGEHSDILGRLDRIIRSTNALPDQTVEDKDVFFLRVRELLATVRRHEAEEDRLFYLAVWRETGGES
ncbi:MAG: hemerythrin domain-containing protein [Planctomycetes bacterium]|nr:hemerythrin domain-containing protein [Planctomycetota bacterium]